MNFFLKITALSILLLSCKEIERKKQEKKIEESTSAELKRITDRINFEKYCKGKNGCTQEDANKMALEDMINRHKNK